MSSEGLRLLYRNDRDGDEVRVAGACHLDISTDQDGKMFFHNCGFSAYAYYHPLPRTFTVWTETEELALTISRVERDVVIAYQDTPLGRQAFQLLSGVKIK